MLTRLLSQPTTVPASGCAKWNASIPPSGTGNVISTRGVWMCISFDRRIARLIRSRLLGWGPREPDAHPSGRPGYAVRLRNRELRNEEMIDRRREENTVERVVAERKVFRQALHEFELAEVLTPKRVDPHQPAVETPRIRRQCLNPQPTSSTEPWRSENSANASASARTPTLRLDWGRSRTPARRWPVAAPTLAIEPGHARPAAGRV